MSEEDLRRPPEQCVILVGGLGSRLGALTGGRPKPLADVGGRPFLDHLLWRAERIGFSSILLLAGHKAVAVETYAAERGSAGVPMEVCIEPEPLGTAGALRYAADRLSPRFLLLNGDSLFDFPWLSLCSAADGTAKAVMALRWQADASRYGLAVLANGRIDRFSPAGGGEGGLINGGVYLMSRQTALSCPSSGSLEAEVLPKIAAEGRLRGLRRDGFFLDIGVPDALAAAQTLVPASREREGAVVVLEPGALSVSAGPGLERLTRAARAVNEDGRFVFLAAALDQDADAADLARAEDVLRGIRSRLRDLGSVVDDVVATKDPARLFGRLCEDWPLLGQDLERIRLD